MVELSKAIQEATRLTAYARLVPFLFVTSAWADTTTPATDDPHFDVQSPYQSVGVASEQTAYFLSTFIPPNTPRPANSSDPLVPTLDFQAAPIALGDENAVPLRFYGFSTTKGYFYVFAKLANLTYVPLTVTQCTQGLDCSSPNIPRPQSGASQFLFKINLRKICVDAATTTAIGCLSGEVDLTTNPIPGFTFYALQSDASDPTTVASTDIEAGELLAINPQVDLPVVSCNGKQVLFRPGDSSIYVDPSQVNHSVPPSPANVTSPLFDKIMVAASKDTLTGTFSDASIFARVDSSDGFKEIPGFENSTETHQVFYEVAVGARDSSGATSYCTPNFTNLFASELAFLKKSNCFISSAAYHATDVLPIRILQSLRSHFLSRFSWGRGLTRWYYDQGPKAIPYIYPNPFLRAVVLRYLSVIEFWSALVNTWLTGAIAAEAPSPAPAVDEAPSGQPFIDQERKKLDADPKKKISPGSYIESVKKTLPSTENKNSYTEIQKKILDQKNPQSADSFTERARLTLPKNKSDGAIADYKNKIPLKAKMEPAKNAAVGIRVGAYLSRVYDSTSGNPRDFKSVYPASYIPEFGMSYEYRPFKTGALRKTSWFNAVTFSFTRSHGSYAFNDGTFNSTPPVNLRFITVPVLTGLLHRFANGSIFEPYIGAGPSITGIIETRNDNIKNSRGFTVGVWANAGIAIDISGVSQSFLWSAYQGLGIHEIKFFAEFFKGNSLSPALVDMDITGAYAGFLFEL